MITFKNLNSATPYKKFLSFYKEAIEKNQPNIEAVSISSFDREINEVQSRFVNLKYIIDDEWIFFSNYQSPKAKSFESHDQITALFYWNTTNIQTRIKANIYKSTQIISDMHFNNRSNEKNIIAVISNQSKKINSPDDVKNKFDEVVTSKNFFDSRPDYWGGYSFNPFYFEFWKGDDNRQNKREVYELKKNSWEKSYLQPQQIKNYLKIILIALKFAFNDLLQQIFFFFLKVMTLILISFQAGIQIALSKKQKTPLNDKIQADEVMLIGVDGEKLGLYSIDKALDAAKKLAIDLVQVSPPDSDPVVCKLLDYGKFLFGKKKSSSNSRSKSKKNTVKEIKFRPSTDIGDYNIKLKKIKSFINAGDKTKITVRFRGREILNSDMGLELLKKLKNELEDIAQVDQEPSLEGRQLLMVMTPLKK